MRPRQVVKVRADISDSSPASTAPPTISARRSTASPRRSGSGETQERQRLALGVERRAAADGPQRAVGEEDRGEDHAVVARLDAGHPQRALDDLRRVLAGGDEEGGEDVGIMGVEAERAGGDRAEEVLPVLHLDQLFGVGLQDALEHVGLDDHLGVDALAAPLVEVDRRRLAIFVSVLFAMVQPVKGAMYCIGAGSDAVAATMMEFQRALLFQRLTNWATVERFWPIAT